MSDITATDVRELADQARTYLSSDLYPAVIGGLGVYALLEYLNANRLIDVWTMAISVIEHARGAGWRLRQGSDGFWEAYGPPNIRVNRELESPLWTVTTPDRLYESTRVDLDDDVSTAVRDNGTAIVHWCDRNTLTARRQASQS